MMGRALPWQDRRGTVAIIFAVALVPLIGFLALAVDFSMVTMARAQIQAAGDSAALKAITAASAAYQSNPSSNYLAVGQAAGVSFYKAQLGKMTFGTTPTPTVTVTSNGETFNAVVTSQVSVPTAFAGVLGFSNLQTTSSSSSSLTNPSYVAIQILMDMSPSMGILIDTVNDPLTLAAEIKNRLGNTAPPGGSTLLASAVGDGLATVKNYQITPTGWGAGACAFACHFDNTNTGPLGQSNDYYGIAEALGLQLRIDVLRSAVKSIIQQVIASPNAKYFQFGLYGFAAKLKTIFPMSNDLASAYNYANNISLIPTAPYCGNMATPPFCGDSAGPANGVGSQYRTGAIPETNFEASAQSLISSTLTPTPVSNGVSASTPTRYMFIITDGLDDYTSTTTLDSGCCNQFIGAVNTMDGVGSGPATTPSMCDQIKAKGVKILVLYTTYNMIAGSGFTSQVAGPFAMPVNSSRITDALQACASPGGNYFQANSPTEIQAAMANMLAIASAKVGRFTH